MRAVKPTFFLFGILLSSALMAPAEQSTLVATVDSCRTRISLLGDTPSEQFRRWPKSEIRSTRAFLNSCLGKFGKLFDSMECAIVDSVNTDTRAVLDGSEKIPPCGSPLPAGYSQRAASTIDLSAGLIPSAQPKSAFKCGDDLRPGVTNKQLSQCYEYERNLANQLARSYVDALTDAQRAKDEFAAQDSFEVDGKTLDLKSLATKYNELVVNFNDLGNRCNANLKSWATEEQECNAQEARQVANYNNLVSNYNNLLHLANTPPRYPAYTPTQPQRIYCNTVYNTTSCYWQ